MKQALSRDLVLAGALGTSYWAAIALGDGHTLLWVMAAFPLLAAVFFAFVARRRGAALLILLAAAALPPATYAFLLIQDMGKPYADECNFGPALALFGLMIGSAQLFAIGLLGPLILALRTRSSLKR